MTSKERHEMRYQRRKQKRLQKKAKKLQVSMTYDKLFTYENLFDAFYFCKKGVLWKRSVQMYNLHLLRNTLSIYNTLRNREFKPLGFLEFDIIERGKVRHIRALKIKERCIQKVLCDKYLIPILRDKLIYDNGASLKGKGTDFSLRRIKVHLQRHFRKYGNEGYILQYDFSSFFDSINHDILLSLLDREILDKEIFKVLKQMIKSFGDKGLGLGSQASQICATYFPTLLDRYFKEKLHIKGYGRYMDDGYMICKSKQEVKKCIKALKGLCDILNLTINPKKLKISKLSKTFTFLKKRIFMTESGKIVVKMGKESIVRARRRLKKLFKRMSLGKIDMLSIVKSYNSWLGLAKRYKNYHVVRNYMKLFRRLCNKYDIDPRTYYTKRKNKKESPLFIDFHKLKGGEYFMYS